MTCYIGNIASQLISGLVFELLRLSFPLLVCLVCEFFFTTRLYHKNRFPYDKDI